MFLENMKQRRSIYALGKEVTLSDDELVTLIQDIVKLSPTAFNNQTTRAVILLHKHHDKLWDIVYDTLKPIVPEGAFTSTAEKLAGFKASYGTILFFSHESTVKKFEEDFALYKDNFEPWAWQGNGIAQFAVWVALSEANIGANLQHYNPLINDVVHKEWDIPSDWILNAQMPFGSIQASAGDKKTLADDVLFKVFK